MSNHSLQLFKNSAGSLYYIARRKAEEARKKLIQTQKQMIIQRAEKMNYMVNEQQVGGEVQLVLIRRHY